MDSGSAVNGGNDEHKDKKVEKCCIVHSTNAWVYSMRCMWVYDLFNGE